jgi:hypothetical protein
MAAIKSKGPGDKVSRLVNKAAKAVGKFEKAKSEAKGSFSNKVVRLAGKAGKAIGKSEKARGPIKTESARQPMGQIQRKDAKYK